MLSDAHNIDADFFGRPLEDATPVSGMVLSELQILQPLLLPDWDGKLLPVPKHLQSRPD